MSVALAPTFPTTGGAPIPVAWSMMFPFASVKANTTISGETMKSPGYPAVLGPASPGAWTAPFTVAVPVTQS